MAEKSAATATASAAPAESASGPGAAQSNVSTPVLSPELIASPSFDVEAFLAGETQASDATETNSDAEPAEDTPTEESDADTATADDADDETAAETEGEEAEPGADEAKSEDDPNLEGLKPKAIKRFNKLLTQRDEALAAKRAAEAELAELKTKLEQRADEPQPVKVDSNPLATVTNEEQLEAHEQYYEQVQAWCRRNPQGGTPPKHLTGNEERELDADMVVTNLEHAERMLNKALPKHREFLQAHRAKRAEARAAHPKVFTAGTPEHDLAKALMPRLLNFASQADQDALLAKLVKAELMEREERDGVARYTRVELKKPATPAKPAAAKPAPKPALTSTTVPLVKATTNGKSAVANNWERLKAPGASVDMEDLMDEAA
jgi:hypothetical protein